MRALIILIVTTAFVLTNAAWLLGATSNIDFFNLRETQPATVTLDAYLKTKTTDAWQFLNSRIFSRSLITIGIIDTGGTSFHPEFRGVSFGNSPANTKIDSGIFNAELGRVETHGTNVNGIIGANNISATSGANYLFPHMNGVVSGVNNLEYALDNRKIDLGGLGVITLYSSVKNVYELANDGATVINLSFGGTVFNPAALPVFASIFSYYSDILFIVAAGNSNIDAEKIIPSGLGDNFNNAITVGGSTLLDGREGFSNFGSAVNIAAPADAVWSPTFFEAPLDLFNDYEFFSGTSASAPLVTGVAGLLKAIKPELTPAEIKDILIRTADPIQTGEPNKRIGTGCYADPNDPINTGCRLNALRAVTRLFPSATTTLTKLFEIVGGTTAGGQGIGVGSHKVAVGQTISPEDIAPGTIKAVELTLSRVGNPTDEVIVSLRHDLSGPDLASATISAVSVSTYPQTDKLTLALNSSVPSSEVRALYLYRSGPQDFPNYIQVMHGEQINQYPNGDYFECPEASPCNSGGAPFLDLPMALLGDPPPTLSAFTSGSDLDNHITIPLMPVGMGTSTGNGI